MFLLGFTEFMCFSPDKLGKDLSLAFRALGRGFLSASMKNSIAINFPLLYASTTEVKTLRYLDYITKFSFLSLLLLPL